MASRLRSLKRLGSSGEILHWQAVYAGGKGAVTVTDVRCDERTESDYVQIAVPALEEGSGRFVGVVGALVDISGLFSAFEQQQLGRTGRIRLVKGSGIIVDSPNVTPDLRLMSEEFTAVRSPRHSGGPTGRLCDHEEWRAYCRLRRHGAEAQPTQLGLLILVSQSEREALGPVRTTWRKSWRIWKCWRLGGHRQGKQRQPEE